MKKNSFDAFAKDTKRKILYCFDYLLDWTVPVFTQQRSVREWAAVLKTDARLYTGLYAGLVRVADGKAKASQKMLREWYDRTRFKWENGEITKLCKHTLKPVIERGRTEECARWAMLLLRASEKAGIHREEAETLILDEKNAAAYTEWNGEDLFVGDTVKIMNPAWYQDNKVIEQGTCTIIASGEE